MRSYIRPAKVARGLGCEWGLYERRHSAATGWLGRCLSACFVVLVAGFGGGHIRCCGCGGWRFCLYGGGRGTYPLLRLAVPLLQRGDGVHIHSCGNGHLGFRPYGESLFFKRQKKEPKNACPSMAPSLGLGVPSLRHCSGGPPPTGHPWPGAASSASMPSCPLRNAYARPAGKGPEDQDQDQKPKPRCACRLHVTRTSMKQAGRQAAVRF
ncbi:hypothetical protein SAMN05216178_3456 [Pseudomonas saponiphila]|uniref:Uncharacterized protein n=1 Tax=Pseudomonas saponiphila TaxID=556534 RepID=A0A1H4PSL5_9PSED|nr:hypothetical protein SAMN05216178_3456 [Pseudomonas saponiphila]